MKLLSAAEILSFISSDTWMMGVLREVAQLELPDGWVGAGFIRTKVWDVLQGHHDALNLQDVDVIYFDPGEIREDRDVELEEQLAMMRPDVPWQVRNQARMHHRNGDAPYASSADAMAHWPETATAVAVRLGMRDRLELLAPLGLSDLLRGIVRPSPAFESKMDVYWQRQLQKRWDRRWKFVRYQ